MSSKKSFKDINPALEYISSYTEPTTSEVKAAADQSEPAQQNSKLNLIIETVNNHEVKQESKKEEKRDKRFSLAVQPSLHDDLLVAATIYRTNLNDLCNSILTEYVEGKRDQINKFKELSSQFLK